MNRPVRHWLIQPVTGIEKRCHRLLPPSVMHRYLVEMVPALSGLQNEAQDTPHAEVCAGSQQQQPVKRHGRPVISAKDLFYIITGHRMLVESLHGSGHHDGHQIEAGYSLANLPLLSDAECSHHHQAADHSVGHKKRDCGGNGRKCRAQDGPGSSQSSAQHDSVSARPVSHHLSGYGKHKIIQDHVYDKKHIYV